MNNLLALNHIPTILVTDDTPENITLVSAIFKDSFKVKAATTGEKALRIARNDPFIDLILLDIVMPNMDGYEVCKQLKADERTKNIPVIFLTSKTDLEDEKHGLDLGAVDYIFKPLSPPIIKAKVITHINLKSVTDFLRDENAFLEQEVQRRTQEIQAIQEVSILALASLAETRDKDTGNHLRRTQLYVGALAKALKRNPRFQEFLTDSNISLLFKSAPLHDIGKVGIPDRILLKPDRLDKTEFEIMKTHSIQGREAIERAENSLGISMEFLNIAKDIVLYHHEKWDGSGYPEGLTRNEIPIPARIMALADVYDALICHRVYKKPMSHEEAASIILEGRGVHFDPEIVDAFIRVQDEFRRIANSYKDSEVTEERLVNLEIS